MKKEKKVKRIDVLIKVLPHVCPLCGGDISEEVKKYVAFRDELEFLKNNKLKLNKPMTRRNKININVDHIVPRSLGGTSCWENLQLTHSDCNVKKGSTFML